MLSAMMDDFTTRKIQTGDARIFARMKGAGPALLLLHGFPETHLMWRDVARLLARKFTVVCADLTGYGESTCPISPPDHARYSKRSMASDLVNMMEQLGFSRFSVAGHDRGGRVAYRMALDHTKHVVRVAVLDVLPTDFMWNRADARLALSFWPWSLLAQPEPLPERMLVATAAAVVENALESWGSSGSVFSTEIRTAYAQSLRDPEHAHAICEEYRAAATIDREHDQLDRATGRRIACPLLALWSARGALESWFTADGGPLQIWRMWADDVRGWAVNAGHFFPEEEPNTTADALMDFFSD